MANVVAAIADAEWTKLERRTKGLTPRAPMDVNVHVDKHPATDGALDALREKGSALFLVAVRPGKKLALVSVLENPTRKGKQWVAAKPSKHVVADVSALRAKLGSLQTAQVISDALANRLREAGTYEPRAAKATKPTKTKPTKTKPTRLSSIIRDLIQAAREEIINEYLDDLETNADELIVHGVFSLKIQSVFSGMYKATAETLVVLREIAPYVAGPGVVHRLGILANRDATAVQIANELVDAFAVSAVDTFGTALAALATNQAARVPPSAKPLLPHLEKQAAIIKKALRERAD